MFQILIRFAYSSQQLYFSLLKIDIPSRDFKMDRIFNNYDPSPTFNPHKQLFLEHFPDASKGVRNANVKLSLTANRFWNYFVFKEPELIVTKLISEVKKCIYTGKRQSQLILPKVFASEKLKSEHKMPNILLKNVKRLYTRYKQIARKKTGPLPQKISIIQYIRTVSYCMIRLAYANKLSMIHWYVRSNPGSQQILFPWLNKDL